MAELLYLMYQMNYILPQSVTAALGINHLCLVFLVCYSILYFTLLFFSSYNIVCRVYQLYSIIMVKILSVLYQATLDKSDSLYNVLLFPLVQPNLYYFFLSISFFCLNNVYCIYYLMLLISLERVEFKFWKQQRSFVT